jgi:hypothetical protein
VTKLGLEPWILGLCGDAFPTESNIPNEFAISWKSKRQPTIALSTAGAEYMAASRASQEVVYRRRLLNNLGFTQSNPTIINEDNKAAIMWSESPVGFERERHIDLRKYFVHEKIKELALAEVMMGVIKLQTC